MLEVLNLSRTNSLFKDIEMAFKKQFIKINPNSYYDLLRIINLIRTDIGEEYLKNNIYCG
ncbi:hypothetical protein F0310_02995 [Borrelia sp. A-FGy1]|uniref:hypothetical protein n=1 Tax=Borrelia sp. A-FGy1 TaxID=2608247 RepID=UPI0015F3BC2C|nr:hypothetical protein [Borrelia sp. A-FGy1]QMU99370.1 hypothetical protein F0310_02995 [Borrelia sp. A-FGy1]